MSAPFDWIAGSNLILPTPPLVSFRNVPCRCGSLGNNVCNRVVRVGPFVPAPARVVPGSTEPIQ